MLLATGRRRLRGCSATTATSGCLCRTAQRVSLQKRLREMKLPPLVDLRCKIILDSQDESRPGELLQGMGGAGGR